MNEKAVIYILYFGIMSFVTRFFNKWILLKVYQSANLTLQDVLEKRMKLKASNNAPRKLTNWILSVSPNKKETKKWFLIYNLIALPALICMNISITGLFTHIFDTFLDYASIGILLLNFITVIYGVAKK